MHLQNIKKYLKNLTFLLSFPIIFSCNSTNTIELKDSINTKVNGSEKVSLPAIKIGNEFQINSSGAPDYPIATIDKIGNYLFVWESSENNKNIIKFQRFKSNGEKDGGETEVTSVTKYRVSSPKVLINEDGSFNIFWIDLDNVFGFSFKIYSQQFNKDGIKQGEKVFYEIENFGFVEWIDIKDDTHGNYIIAWDDLVNTEKRVYAQKFSKNGKKLSNLFSDNSFFSGAQYGPKIVVNKTGRFIIFLGESSGFDSKKHDSMDGSYPKLGANVS